MGQSLSQIYVHLVFGTKNRERLIAEESEEKLHSYLAGILKKKDSTALIINSVPDHVHILFRLSKNLALADVIENVKKDSSKWMKEQGIRNFSWQIGYGAFSVSSSRVEAVTKYISNQKEHHKKQSFKEEIEMLFREYGLSEYQENYFWR